MKEVKPKKVAGDKPGVKIDDYWEVGKALLQDPQKFLDSLFKYDRDNIPDSVITKIQPYIDNEDFTPSAIARVSKACTSICQWVRAMHKYHFVARAVAPKRVSTSTNITMQHCSILCYIWGSSLKELRVDTMTKDTLLYSCNALLRTYYVYTGGNFVINCSVCT